MWLSYLLALLVDQIRVSSHNHYKTRAPALLHLMFLSKNVIYSCRRQCRANEFKCANNLCVGKVKFCNGIDECGDRSDEPENCTKCVVKLGAFSPVSIFLLASVTRFLECLLNTWPFTIIFPNCP